MNISREKKNKKKPKNMPRAQDMSDVFGVVGDDVARDGDNGDEGDDGDRSNR